MGRDRNSNYTAGQKFSKPNSPPKSKEAQENFDKNNKKKK